MGTEPMAASIGEGGSGADRTRAEEIKPASNGAHASVDGCREDRLDSSAKISTKKTVHKNM